MRDSALVRAARQMSDLRLYATSEQPRNDSEQPRNGNDRGLTFRRRHKHNAVAAV